MSRVRAPELVPRRRVRGRTPERDAFLRANAGVSAAILAAEMGLKESFVLRYQLVLGLRRFSHSKDYRERACPAE